MAVVLEESKLDYLQVDQVAYDLAQIIESIMMIVKFVHLI